MPRRVTLPGADELFRSTVAPTQVDDDVDEAPAASAGSGRETHAPRSTGQAPSGRKSGATTGRERHEEKITVYVSDKELIEIEQCRLTLRATHRLAVDRGRIVREALAVVLADFDAKGGDSILVRRLRPHL